MREAKAKRRKNRKVVNVVFSRKQDIQLVTAGDSLTICKLPLLVCYHYEFIRNDNKECL
jgi:hypothetical protein